MHIIRDGVQLDIITLRYDSKCAECGGKILADTQVCWWPGTRWSHGRGRVKTHTGITVEGIPVISRLHYPGTAKMVGTVTHHPDAPCANEYHVKAIYDATSKTVVVTAYRAEMALETVWKQLGRRKTVVPSAYIVYHGNVPVLTRLQKDMRIDA